MILNSIAIRLALAFLLFTSSTFSQGPNTKAEQAKGRFVSVLFETDQATVDKLIPKKYQSSKSKVMDMNIGTWVLPDGSIYHDAFLQIPVLVEGKEAFYVPIGYIDSETELANTKSTLHTNRKLANFQINHYRNKIFYKVSAKEEAIATADYSMGEQELVTSAPDRIGVSSLPENGKPEMVKVSFVITRSFQLQGSLSLGNLPEFLIPTIPIIKLQKAFYYEADETVTK